MIQRVTQVGFIGLGRMGKPMAVNILRAGFSLTVYDSRQEPVGELAALGARAAGSSKEVAETSDIVATAVVDDAQVEVVVTGPGGVLEGARSGTIIAIHSTISPETAQRLSAVAKEKGVHVLDAPISGGEAGARQQSLCYMVGGEQVLIERCREVFASSASAIFRMGDVGSGAAAKMVVQVVTCINMLAAHEAELLSAQCALDFPALQKVLNVSSAQSFVAENWLDRFKIAEDPMEVRRRRTEVFQKSLGPALALAQQLGLSLPGASLTEQLLPRIMGIEES
jgi:3-hydroxyisobutyrate dehydrogenase-like beta-hydroxyacid dehydrogenase